MTDAELQEIGRKVAIRFYSHYDITCLFAEAMRLRNLLLSWDVCPDCGKFAERGECRCRD